MKNLNDMATRSNSSSNTLLLVLILVITFPIWIALAGVAIGLVAGLFGAMVGVVGAIFGALIGVIVLPFKIIFGWGHHDHWYHGFPHFHSNWFTTLAIIIIIGIVLSKRKK